MFVFFDSSTKNTLYMYNNVTPYCLLSSVGRPGVKDTGLIQKLADRIIAALKMELGKNHPEDEELKARLMEKIPTVHTLSAKHVDVLNRFKISNPSVEFPALHKELFSPEGTETM